MSAVAAPFGLRPVNLQGGRVMTHALRQYKITPAYATNIFYGDVCKLAAGLLEKETGTTGISPIGVFLGCEYHDPAMGLLHRQYWPASTVVKTGTDAFAYVCDDPGALFEIQANGAVAQAKLGQNADLIQTAGSTATGNSKVALNAATIAVTATFPLRIIDFVRRPGSAIGDAYTDLIVRFNTHLNNAAGGAA